MKIKGYKCFNKNLVNRYGKEFAVGQIYIARGILKYGNDGNGFHLCKNIEDTFRFFDTSKKDICICEVIGSGKMLEREDCENEYFDMYCVEKLEIIKQLTREEIISTGLALNQYRVKRFISTLSLTPKEIELFKQKFYDDGDILDAIAYYQEGNLEIYNKVFQKTNNIDKKI